MIREYATITVLVAALPMAAALQERVIQTNSAGDNVHVIDPTTNKVIGTTTRPQPSGDLLALPTGPP